MTQAGLVTILFTDLVGSTDLASQLGDVAADEVRRLHFASLREVIVATGGTEVKTIGDAIMVSYRGAADALAGGVGMQRAVERQNRGVSRNRLEMRVGISAGDATFENGDWFGTPVVEAARLCSDANGGQILTSELVRALAGSRCEYPLSSLGPRQLKGLANPLAVCEVEWRVRESSAPTPLPGFVDASPAFPFAGRTEPFETLLHAWKETLEGTRRAILVSGEPGIGKTRLVTELVRHAHDAGASILWGRSDDELASPFEPFVEALRHYIQTVPLDRLRAELGPLGGELSRVLPDLAARVPGLAAPVPSDPETERHRLFEAVTDLLGEMSHSHPVILVLDDLHWADKPSLLLLRHLLRSATPMRLLVLATYRDTDLDRTHPLADVLADLRREPGVTRLDLTGLDPSEVAILMERAAGHDLDGAALELARVLQHETQGNPFFVGEVLRHLAETGAIFERDGRWTSDRTLEEVGIPEGIREVVGRRLSRLSDAANRALALGAVIGAQFDLATVEAAGGPRGDELFDALDEAERHAIVREVTGTAGRYAFTHALVRSALYEELSTNHRVRMHQRVARVLEARHQHHIERHLEELAYHFAEGALAGDPMTAVDYGRRAGEQADAQLAFESAAAHYDRALGTLDLVADADPMTRCDLQIALATALYNAGDRRSRQACFEAAATAGAAGDADRMARAAMVLCSGAASSDAVVDPDLVALLEAALDVLSPASEALRARLLSALAAELQWGPEAERRIRLAQEALTLARSTRDPEALSLVLRKSWALLDGSKPFWEAFEPLLEEAESVVRDIGDSAALAEVLRSKAFMAASRGNGEAFSSNLAAASQLRDALRRPRLNWTIRNDDAALACFVGELDRAEQLAIEAVDIGRAAGVSDDLIIAGFAGLLYPIRMGQGRIAELVPLLEARVEAIPEIPTWRIALAGALTESDRLDEARVHYLWLAENGCAKVPRDVQFAVTVNGLARMAFRIRPEEAIIRDVYDRLVPLGGLFPWTGQSLTDATDLGLAMAATALERDDDADLHFADAVALCERAGARSYLARCHLDWARALAVRKDAAQLVEHATIARDIGRQLNMTGPHGVVTRAQALLDMSRRER